MCEICVQNQATPKSVPLLLWPWSTEPWQRIHMDYLEIKGQQFLLVVDSHSKWMEVFHMNSTTASSTLNVLSSLFARYGFPKEVVTDNGPQFIAVEFGVFMRDRGIKHTLCPPYHPASNGLAERHVQTFKLMFKKYEGSRILSVKVSDILFHYRNTPSSTTGMSPAELFLKRTPRTKLSLIKPSLQGNVELKQVAAKMHHDGKCPIMRNYEMYQRVLVRNVRGGKEKWVPGTVVKITGPSTYVVRMFGNVHRFVHADHLTHNDSLEGSVPKRPAESLENLCQNDSDSMNIQSPDGLISGEESPQLAIPDKHPDLEGCHLESPIGGPSGAASPKCKEATPGRLPTPVKVSRSGRLIKPPRKLNL